MADMTDDERQRFERLYAAAERDEDGHIVPTDTALERVEIEYPDHPDHEKWRLAQAATLIELQERAKLPDPERN